MTPRRLPDSLSASAYGRAQRSRRVSTLLVLLAFLVAVASPNIAPRMVQAAVTDADLTIYQSGPDGVATGADFSYLIELFNGGPASATGVTVTDTLPAGVTFGSASPTQGTCDEAAGVVTCDLGSVSTGTFPTITLSVTAPATTGDITNSATVQGAEVDPNTADNVADWTTSVFEPQVDLSVYAYADASPVVTGAPLTYTVEVDNSGTLDATGVVLADTLPAGVAFQSASPGCTQAAGVVTCILGDLAASDFAQVEIAVVAPASPGTITNSVEVTGDQADAYPDDNTTSIDIEVVAPSADLSIYQFDSADPVGTGDSVTYTVTVGNGGPLDATNVTMTDTLPTGSTFVSATPTSGSCGEAAGIVTCGLGTVAYFDSVDVDVTVTAPGTPATITNSVGVSADQDDTDPANNNSTEDTQVVMPAADLAVTKSDAPDPVAPGGAVTYTVDVTNLGPVPATGVTLVDTLPGDATFVSAEPALSCAEASGTVTCDLGDIGASSTQIVTIVVTAPSFETTLSSAASVSASSPTDPDLSNNDVIETTAVRTPTCTSNTLAPNDDGSTGLVDIGFTINFFGSDYSQLYVNNNGNVTFTEPLVAFTPDPIVGTGLPIIAPFWADVDTRAAGSAPVTYGQTTFEGHPAFCVEWSGVGYYAGHDDLLNDFDLLLVDRSDVAAGDFDMIFTYRQVEWETGDASSGVGGLGGISARAGYSNGDTGDLGGSLELPGSAVNGGLLDSNLATGLVHNMRNSSTPGVYVFPVRNGAPPPPTADLQITKADAVDPVDSGTDITYTITVTNNGPDAATGVTMDDTLPSEVSFVSADSDVGSCAETSGTVSCDIGSLAPGAVATVTLVVTAPVVGTTTDVTNSATVTGDQADSDTANNTAAQTTTVSGPNNPPTATDDDASTNETRPTTIDVLGNDTDPDFDTLSVTNNTAPANGTVDCSSGTECIYTPNAGYIGGDTFDYTVSDGELTDVGTVTITVLACPVLADAIDGGGIVTGQEWIACSSAGASAATGVHPAHMTPDGATLGLLTTGTAAGVENPDPGTFLSTANGLSLRGAQDVSILKLDLGVPTGMNCLGFDLVFGSEEYPQYVGAFNDAFLAELDTSTWSVSGNIISAPNNFAFDHLGGVVSVNSAFFDASTVVTDAGVAYNGLTSLLAVRTPVTPGSHALYLSIFDANDEIFDSGAFVDHLVAFNAPSGECTAGANQPPSAVGDSFGSIEDSVDNLLDVLANDTDPDTDPISLNAVTVAPQHGTATVDAGTQRVLYTPDANYNGLDSFTYQISDGRGAFASAIANLTVLPVNDQPTAADDAVTPPQDTPLDINLGPLVADIETATADLTYEIVDSPLHGSLSGSGPVFTYAPDAGYAGADSFTYRVTDRGDPDNCTGGLPACTSSLTSTTQTISIDVLAGTYTLDVTPAGDGSGTVTSLPAGIDCGLTCSAPYSAGSSVTLTASPDAGSLFSGWSGDCSGSGDCILTMDGDHSVTATFSLPTYTLDVTPAGDGSGTVTSLPAGIDCGLTCSAPYSAGSSVTLTASPDAGSLFSGWSGDCSGSGDCILTMDGDHSVTATFSLPTYTLDVTPAGDGSGTVTSLPAGIDCGLTCSAPYSAGSSVTLTASPNAGSLFSGWSGDCSGSGDCILTMDGDHSVTATFSLPTYTLDVTPAGDGSGTVTSLPAGIDCGLTCSAPYSAGSSVTLTASPNAGSLFSGWSGDCSGSGDCILTMDGDHSVTATFSLPTYTLDVTPAGDGSGTVTSLPAGIDCGLTCSAPYSAGSSVTLTASPDAGSLFSGWSGDCSGSGDCILTMDGDHSVTATFSLPTYTLDVTPAGDGSGTVTSLPAGIDCGLTCSAPYSAGSSVTLTASPDAGSLFSGWSGDCSGSGDCILTMDGDHSVTATFSLPILPSADLNVSQTDAPDPVTGGNALNYTVSVTNLGPDSATNVVVTDILPASVTFNSAEGAACTFASGVVTCVIASLAPGETVTVSITVGCPAVTTATAVTNMVSVNGDQMDPDTANNMSAATSTIEPAASDPDTASGWITAAGGTVKTGGRGGTSRKDQMTTEVAVPPGYPGEVTISEGPITSCASGFTCFGQQADITAPTTTAAQPLRITFRYHPSALPPSTQLNEIVMFHDDAPLPRCDSTSGIAAPDPCTLSIARIRGEITIVVLTSTNGRWRGGS